MQNIRKINDDLVYVGASDRRLALFENIYPIPRGVSYNSYLLLDEKTVLLDTADAAVSQQFFENVAAALDGRTLDYLVVNHMEPDHCALIEDLVLRYPAVKVVTNAKAAAMIRQFFTFDIDSRLQTVAEGDTLVTGRHTLTFVMAPMVHWPEAMVTYDLTDKVLFSADAFGTFGALNGNIFADEVHFDRDWLDDARRYFINIVGKYGVQVQAILKKAATLEINAICPLHGPIWRQDLDYFIGKYNTWSLYKPEQKGVAIIYASIYGHTAAAAEKAASLLAERGVKNIALYDASQTDTSLLVSECFRFSHILFAASTYNSGIFTPMENLLLDLKAHNWQNRTVALIDNGTWAAQSGKQMRAILEQMKNITLVGDTLSLKSAMKESQVPALEALCDSLIADLSVQPIQVSENINKEAAFKLDYGLYVLTAREGDKDNGCIINVCQQVTDTPQKIIITVNKGNYTHDMILHTGRFNVSVLTEHAPFKVFEHFGFQSGRDVNKFADCEVEARTANGLRYIPKYTNACLSGLVLSSVDLGTHTLFIAQVTESILLNNEPSLTYGYYRENIKPKPADADSAAGPRWVCEVCGYVYEGDELPDDFICPWCKHGKADFIKQ